MKSFHDGNLMAVLVKDDRHAEVWLRDSQKDSFKLTLSQVDRLRCFDFREGNIVSVVMTTVRASPVVGTLKQLFDLDAEESVAWLDERIRKIEAGDLTLLHIVPSYGCELIALCGEVRLEKISD